MNDTPRAQQLSRDVHNALAPHIPTIAVEDTHRANRAALRVFATWLREQAETFTTQANDDSRSTDARLAHTVVAAEFNRAATDILTWLPANNPTWKPPTAAYAVPVEPWIGAGGLVWAVHREQTERAAADDDLTP